MMRGLNIVGHLFFIIENWGFFYIGNLIELNRKCIANCGENQLVYKKNNSQRQAILKAKYLVIIGPSVINKQ